MLTPFGGTNTPTRDVAYSFKCEHCGKDSGWLIWRTNAAGLEQMAEKGEYLFPEKCRLCGKKQSWGTKAALKKYRNIWIGIVAVFSAVMFVGMILSLTGYDSTDLDFPNTLLMMGFFFVFLSPVYLIPLAVRKIRDSRVARKQLPEVRWAVNYVVSNAAPASGDKNAQPDNSNKAGGQKVKGVRELNNENFWHCPSCGRLNSGGFCTDCGKKKPTAQAAETQNVDQGHYGQRTAPAQWKCPACETLNSGDFCIVCGKKRPM